MIRYDLQMRLHPGNVVEGTELKPANPPTIKDIARLLGMSHSTVSRALTGRAKISEETTRRVHAAAAELGYVPNLSARAIRGDAGLLIGLLIPDVQNDFFASLAKILSELARKDGFRLLLAISENDPHTEEKEVRGLLEARVAGIVATITDRPTQATVNLLKGTVCVQMGSRVAPVAGPSICLADEAGCRDATAHLLNLGHRNIAFLGPDEASEIGRDRLAGYMAAHASLGLKPLVGGALSVETLPRNGGMGAKRLLALATRPTALLVASSALTLGALTAIQEAGLRVPEDISIIGFGDPAWLELLTPPLTTVGLPVDRLANAAADALVRRIGRQEPADGTPPEQLDLPTQLVVRGSTAAISGYA